ncbi:MAG TPA: phosphoribosylglycinamide formyltransferase [Chitinophagales bacterium]|nr:phosphoribosylglycinamide formyltransferase [Chitinophagales bacterium]
MKNIAIFASGTGSNAAAIIDYFNGSPSVKVALVLTNNPDAGVIKIAHSQKILSAIITKDALQNETLLLKLLNAVNTDLIVLAGFMQLLPQFLIEKFPRRIINIHPALLPKFGGKGMYGGKVHQAVLAAKETETGFTIHYVNEHYDEGEIILQKKVPIDPNDNAETLTHKVQQLEHANYPQVIEKLLLG